MKADALEYFNNFFKISDTEQLNNITNAIGKVLSNEKKNIYDFGVKATEFTLRELLNILDDNVCIYYLI